MARARSVRIRRLRREDYDAVIDLVRRSGLRPRLRGRDGRPAFHRQLRSNRAAYLGAFLGGELVGVVFGTHDTRKGWINRLAVEPEHRRQGVATRLVRAAEHALHKRGMELFAALIEPRNRASVGLFRKLGYESTGILYMRKKLREGV